MPSMHSATRRWPLLSKLLIDPPYADRVSLAVRLRTHDGDAARHVRDHLRANACEQPRWAARAADQNLVDFVDGGKVDQGLRGFVRLEDMVSEAVFVELQRPCPAAQLHQTLDVALGRRS